jgi:hypothetical protein
LLTENVQGVFIPDPNRNREIEGWSLLRDPDRELARLFGVQETCAYLIRPDGYVAYRQAPVDEGLLRDYLASIFAIHGSSQNPQGSEAEH